MDKKFTSVLAYIGIIFWLIAYLAGDKEGAKFHLNQGLALAIVEIICSVLSAIPVIGILFSIVSFVAFIFAIIGIVYAIKGEDKALPLIGKIQILK